jgi:hypothetical protein
LFQPHSPSAALVGGQSTDDFTLLLALSATTADPGEACIVAGRTTGSKASGWCCPLQRRDCTAESSLKSEGLKRISRFACQQHDGGGYELCAGNHRYEAARSLGWTKIDAVVSDFDDLDAEL